MKRKLLLLAAALLCTVGTWAQSWTGGASTEVYLKNVGSNLFWGAANAWGTQASLTNEQQYVKLIDNGDGTFKMESMVSNGGTNYYFNGSYMDGDPVSLTITSLGDGKYSIANGSTYYGWDGSSSVLATAADASSENFQWVGYTSSEIDELNATALSAATAASPVDASNLILDAKFGRNRKNAETVWTITASNKNLNGGGYDGGCAESFHSSFALSQDLSKAPNGKYKLTAQAFYRKDTDAGDNVPYIYITNGTNTSKSNFKEKDAEEGDGMASAATYFKNGDFQLDNIYVVKANGQSLTVGAKLEEETHLWSIWANFQLTYYGNAVEVYSPASFNSGGIATAATWYAFTVSTAGYYKISSAAATTIRYTQDNSVDADNGGSTVALAASGYTVVNLSTGTFYFKSSAGDNNSITIETLSSTNGTVVTDNFITNPSFETGDNTGWSTTAGIYVQNGSDLSNMVGTYYEMLQGKNTHRKAYQTVSSPVPAGKYILSVNAGDVTINMGGYSTPIPSGVDASIYTVAYETAESASPEIKFQASNGSGDLRRCYFDNYVLTYYSTLPDISISDLTACAMDASVRSDLESAKDTYDDSKTAANYNALQTAIINAKNSIANYPTSANSNWTGLIANPSFEGTGTGSIDGWSYETSNDHGAKRNDNATYTMTNVDGDYLFNIWATGNTISQTLTNMPAGTYKLTAVMGTDAGKTFYLKMGGQTGYAESSEDGKGVGVTVTVYAKLAAQGDLTISADAGGSQWYKVDNFQLTYNPTLPASLTKISGPMNGTISSTQDTKVNAYNATSGQTIDNLIDAQEAMLAAYESKLVYNDITTIKNSYDTKASNLDAAGQAAYTTATTTEETGATTKYNAGSYTAASQAETAYHADYITAVKAQGDNSDMTDVIVNPSFETGNYTGWTSNSNNSGYQTPSMKSGGFGANGGNYRFNFWVSNPGKATITQTVSSMPAGHYRLTVYYQTADGAKFSLKANNTGVEEDTNGDLTMATTDFTLASTGNISIEVKFTASWIDLDNFRLTYYDSDVYENREAIIDNNGDITSLIHDNDFQAGVTDWDGGYHCNWVKDRSWRGTSYENNHYEKNANGAMTYTVSNMPAGTYKVVAAARADAGCTIQPEIASTTGTSLTGIGDDRNANSTVEINTNGVEMPYSDLAGFTTQGSAHNWKWITATGTLASAGDLVINFNCTGTSWMAIDDVHLYCTNLDGTSYTYTVDDDHLDAGDKVVTADIVLSNPNTIITSDAAINGAAGAINNNLVDGTIANMVLYDGNAYTSPDDAYAITAATYYRNIAADAKATLMLPFALDATSKAKGTAYAPTRFANDNVSFTSVENPAADVPYVFVPSGDAVTTLTGSRSSAEEGTKQVEGTNVTLYGTYASTTITPNANNYIASQGKLWLVDNTQNSTPFRAYLNVTTPSPVKALTFSFDNETAVSTVEAETGKATIYNLAGQRVNKAQKGLYIVNGKKTYIK